MSELQRTLREELARTHGDLEPELIEVRRNFHREPELRFEEYRTAETVENLLRPLELSVRSGVAGTGLLTDLRGERPGPTVALRADMDALPIRDAKDVPYASRQDGVMHACGHDAHMTIACGVLRVLEPLRAVLPGTLRVIFQPGEEVPAGEKSGAAEIIKAGALESPDVEAILGLHVWPELPAGAVGLQPGVTMAAADSFIVEVRGESSHAGEPHKGRDAIFAASSLVVQLKALLGREIPPGEPAAINVGTIHGGASQSVVADLVALSGTLRSLGGDRREHLLQKMQRVAEGVSSETGCSVRLNVSDSFPAVVNDPELYERALAVLPETLGSDRVQVLTNVPMTADDFAHYLEAVPALYVKLGCASAEGGVYPLHHRCFDIDERVIWTGVEAVSSILLDAMEARVSEEVRA
jgi:N-acetylcysteine deacetylase